MRYFKLTNRHSTKAERRFAEMLKELHIPFKAKVKIKGREIDFLIGNDAIEIDAHIQDIDKNSMLIGEGYNPLHFNNWEVPNLKEWLIKKYVILSNKQRHDRT